MKKYVKKVYLSIMLVVFSLLTMVATTYAWVGLLTSSTFDQFEINLQQNDSPDAAEYGIELSLEGKENTFDTSIDPIKLKRKLLENMGVDLTGKNDTYVNDYFRRNRLDQCTVRQSNNNFLGTFRDMNFNPTNNYYWFDLYISIFKIGGATEEESNNKLNLYLRDHILSSGTTDNPSGVYAQDLFNNITYPSVSDTLFGKKILGDSSIVNSIPAGFTVSDNVRVDVSNACRVAMIKCKATPKYELSGSDVLSENNPLHIYQKGSLYPTYDPISNVYDFGGILPYDYNFAVQYHNSTHPDMPIYSDETRTKKEVPTDIINRGDVTYADDGVVNHIVTTDDEVTIKKMIKFKIYFWFEGWDADCFDIIDNKTVTVNLKFSTKSPNEG